MLRPIAMALRDEYWRVPLLSHREKANRYFVVRAFARRAFIFEVLEAKL
jgi:hypothetical protein